MVSVVIVVRNSEKYIEKCIQSVITQFSDKNGWELLIIDELSNDNTLLKVRNFLKYQNVIYRIIDNPNKSLAAGWNIGIREAIGDFIIRPDAHSELMPGYIKTALKTIMLNKKIGAVGGTLITKSDNFVGRMISIVLSNPIGVGRSLFRIGVKKDIFTNSVVYALYRRQVLLNIGGLNEALIRNQDLDLHNKIISSGYNLMTSSSMKAIYYSRSTLSKYLHQGFENGYWIIKGRNRSFNHIVPLFFFLYDISFIDYKNAMDNFSFSISFISIYIFFILKSKMYNPLKLSLLWILTISLHLAYGLGSFIGIFAKIFRIKLI